MTCLDTNIVIDLLAGDSNLAAILDGYAKSEGLSITAVTEYELLKYCDERERKVVDAFLNDITVHPFDKGAARASYKIFSELRSRGKMINENDILIAGTALFNGELLITRDKKFGEVGSKNVLIV